MNRNVTIRSALPQDASVLLEIYRPFVERTVVSFEMECPTVEEFALRIQKATQGWGWLVAVVEGRCVGYAYASSHRERAAYKWSVETSAYVQPGCQRQGVGRALYAALLARLSERGFCNAYAGIALPNEASIALHRSVGFRAIGVFNSVGRKFGAWHDVSWWQRRLRELPLQEP